MKVILPLWSLVVVPSKKERGKKKKQGEKMKEYVERSYRGI